MNCDQAFDAMTDPVRPLDRELGDHLRACPRCRQMYETLEPALGLFAAVEGDGAETPAAASTTLASSTRLAQQLAGRMLPRGNIASGEFSRRRLWGAVIAAGVAGFLLSVGLSSLTPPHRSSVPSHSSECSWLNRESALDRQPASEVVVACVKCHLSSPHAGRPHSSLRNFSRDLDAIVKAWRSSPTPLNAAIAMSLPIPSFEAASFRSHALCLTPSRDAISSTPPARA